MSYQVGGPSKLFTRLLRYTRAHETYTLTIPPGHSLGTSLAKHGALPDECRDITLSFGPDGIATATYTVNITHDQAGRIIKALDDYEQIVEAGTDA